VSRAGLLCLAGDAVVEAASVDDAPPVGAAADDGVVIAGLDLEDEGAALDLDHPDRSTCVPRVRSSGSRWSWMASTQAHSRMPTMYPVARTSGIVANPGDSGSRCGTVRLSGIV
jgi:hypothetical protein